MHIDSHPSGLQASEEGGMTRAHADAIIDKLDGWTALAAIKFINDGISLSRGHASLLRSPQT